MGIAYTLSWTTFCVAHFLLAWQYKTLSYEVPLAIEGKKSSAGHQRMQKWIYWVLLSLNVVVPMISLLAIADNIATLIKNDHVPTLTVIL